LKRGDVVKAELPRPRGQQSHEQYGYRRAVILEEIADGANPSTIVIVPTTSNLGASRYGESFVVRKSSENGLTCDSTLLVNQIRALDARRIRAVVGQLSETDLAKLEAAVRMLLSL
jgi:mRNA interferase MazF